MHVRRRERLTATLSRVNRAPRTTALVVAAAVLGAGTAGCSFGTPVTQKIYSPGDGVNGYVGEDVVLRNLVVLAPEEGAPGALTGAVENRGEDQVELTFASGGEEAGSLTVGPGEVVLMEGAGSGEGSADILLPSVPERPGALTPLEVASAAHGGVELQVPVLDGVIEYYEPLVPTAEE